MHIRDRSHIRAIEARQLDSGLPAFAYLYQDKQTSVWYWQEPSCEPNGPFDTEEEAYADATCC